LLVAAVQVALKAVTAVLVVAVLVVFVQQQVLQHQLARITQSLLDQVVLHQLLIIHQEHKDQIQYSVPLLRLVAVTARETLLIMAEMVALVAVVAKQVVSVALAIRQALRQVRAITALPLSLIITLDTVLAVLVQ
jgi:hypothetical protein